MGGVNMCLLISVALIHGDHTYKPIWMFDTGGHLKLWVEDGEEHNTYVVVVIMIEYTVECALKAITFHHSLLFNLHTWHYSRVHYNSQNQGVICAQIVATHCGTI